MHEQIIKINLDEKKETNNNFNNKNNSNINNSNKNNNENNQNDKNNDVQKKETKQSFLLDVVFKNKLELNEFIIEIKEKFADVEQINCFKLIEHLKKEEFIPNHEQY
ncbi:hypothetical protein HON01_04815 [Candidatus Woesearchaeota archaeon]|nr:hypothetical protein [Candidatus Woesearchaeota archaeon]MBT7368243.1 hypothetical protein [Candidatus Woesearchaeota archaeon]